MNMKIKTMIEVDKIGNPFRDVVFLLDQRMVVTIVTMMVSRTGDQGRSVSTRSSPTARSAKDIIFGQLFIYV